MSFLDDPTVPNGKTYLRPIKATDNANNYVSDAEWNGVMTKLTDLRTGLVNTVQVGFAEQTSLPAAYLSGGSTTRLWAKTDGQLTFTRSGVNNSIAAIPVTTKGDIAVWNGTAWARLGAGTNSHVLTADSTQATGIKWAAGGAGSSDGLKAPHEGATSAARNIVTATAALGTPTFRDNGGDNLYAIKVQDVSGGWDLLTVKNDTGGDTVRLGYGPWGFGAIIPSGTIRIENTNAATGGSPVEGSPSVFIGGRVWDGSVSRVAGGLISSKSATSGASYTGELNFYVRRNATDTFVGGFTNSPAGNFFICLNVGAAASVQAGTGMISPSIGTDVGNQHTFPTGTDALVSIGASQTLTNKTYSGPTISGDIGGSYNLTGTAVLKTPLGVFTDGTDIGDATHRVDLFALTIVSGASTMGHASTVADGADATGFRFNAVTAMSNASARIAEFQNNSSQKLVVNPSGVLIGTNSSSGHGLYSFTGSWDTSYAAVTAVALRNDASEIHLFPSGAAGSTLYYKFGTAAFFPAVATPNIGTSGAKFGGVFATQYFGTEQTIAAATTITPNPASGEIIRITLSATAITTVNSTAGAAGQRITFLIIQDGTGGRSISGWAAAYVFAGGAYTVTATANKRDVLTFVWEASSSKWYEQSRAMNL